MCDCHSSSFTSLLKCCPQNIGVGMHGGGGRGGLGPPSSPGPRPCFHCKKSLEPPPPPPPVILGCPLSQSIFLHPCETYILTTTSIKKPPLFKGHLFLGQTKGLYPPTKKKVCNLLTGKTIFTVTIFRTCS